MEQGIKVSLNVTEACVEVKADEYFSPSCGS